MTALRSIGFALVLASTLGAQDRLWNEHRATRVLYASSVETARADAFRAFLAKWFESSQALSLDELTPEHAGDFDVLIVDAAGPFTLGTDYTGPIITMNWPGPAERPDLKFEGL